MGRTDTRAVARQLGEMPTFADCKQRDLHRLVESAHRSSVPANWPLIQQSTPGDACYVILDGVASVSVEGEEVAQLGAGAVVGEVALATGKLRNASVTSTTPLDLLHLDVDQFESLLGRRPALKDALLGGGSIAPTA